MRVTCYWYFAGSCHQPVEGWLGQPCRGFETCPHFWRRYLPPEGYLYSVSPLYFYTNSYRDLTILPSAPAPEARGGEEVVVPHIGTTKTIAQYSRPSHVDVAKGKIFDARNGKWVTKLAITRYYNFVSDEARLYAWPVEWGTE